MKMTVKPGRIVLWAVAGLLGFCVLSVLILCLFYPPEFVFRTVAAGPESAYDYTDFPERPLAASANAFHFAGRQDEGRVRAIFEANPKVGNLETLLTGTGTRAFIVIQDDAILYEHYFNRAQRDSLMTSFSVAKSFTSALVGIAIHDGYIKSVDDSITDYLPELASRDARFRDITIRHLLTMSSGLRFDESRLPFDDGHLTYRYTDMRRLALEETEVIGPPGETFLYNPYNTLLLGMILERTTGGSVTEYTQEKIWTPLGMEFGGSWSLDSTTSGFEKMESGVNARAIDFAKLGRLYLNQGKWDSKQVIPADWVADSTRMDAPGADGDYGYLWWGVGRDLGGDGFFALGNLGQFVYVSPANNLVIVRLGEKYGLKGEAHDWVGIFHQFAGDIGER